MNTSQRNVIRIGCYLLAGIAVLYALDAGIFGIVAAVVLVVIGKVVWAGRPMGQIASIGKDVVEVGRAVAEVEPRLPRAGTVDERPDPIKKWRTFNKE